MTKEQIKAELKLFKSFTETDDVTLPNTISLSQLYTQSIQKGVLFKTDKIPTQDVIDIATELYGINANQLNNTFHKSFATVRDTSIDVLVIEQIVHYITTYGFENLGIYDDSSVYIPKEELEIPELEDDVKLNVINYINTETLNKKLMNLLTSGIALSEETLKDIMVLSDYIDKDRFDEIKNKEIKITLYDKYNVVPKNNIEFLRYLIYKTIGSTLLINNVDTIKAIKKANKEKALSLLQLYINQPNGYKKLADIMLRYKNLFLAFKCKDDVDDDIRKPINNIINRIDALSRKYHQKAKVNILDNLTQINTLKSFNECKDDILKELDQVTIFKVVSVLNSLRYRLSEDKTVISSVYTIRNSKIFVRDIKGVQTSTYRNALKSVYDLIYAYLVDKIKNNLDGKTIYIPNNMVYMLPTSEKRFLNNIPEGSYITIDRQDAVIGINWYNLNHERVDLDLKLQNKGESYGWNTSWRSENSDFYFSGDITDALNGATEVFYIGNKCSDKSFFMTLNDYTEIKDQEIPFKFIVARVKDKTTIEKNYVIDPNDVLLILNCKLNPNEVHKLLALIDIQFDTIKVIFRNNSLEKCRVSMMDQYKIKAQTYFDNYSKIQLSLNEVLKDCSVEILDKPVIEKFVEIKDINSKEPVYKKEQYPVDIDLSLENISKDTIINLLQ